ncbi:hypothetical protein CYMTET_9837 [Cymbomonas tetramitiformis]|uniref:NADH:ubiquinone oxidoreductase intermediate-associated protein 30 domain-containing protein n=1 Tax=Cymbomonas tetramitiformis TaxID=36881 RepID=A0AAE0GRX7_9CHLO|nr:hypothetical protein CYMTET_9837 [Cymbomonas tetramitiformis]
MNLRIAPLLFAVPHQTLGSRTNGSAYGRVRQVTFKKDRAFVLPVRRTALVRCSTLPKLWGSSTNSDSTMKAALKEAIQKGAPLYNSGDTTGCWRLYSQTAEFLVEGGLATGCAKKRLQGAIEEGRSAGLQGRSSDAAWALRNAFDEILMGSQPTSGAGSSGVRRPGEAWSLLEVGSKDPSVSFDAAGFGPVNDSVMGGRSSCTLQIGRDDLGAPMVVFSGELSSAGGGGFASVRTEPRRWGCEDADGLLVEARGDGRHYKVNIMAEGVQPGVAYRMDFVANGEWGRIKLPFSRFTPSFRGNIVEAPELRGGRMVQMAIMVSKLTDKGMPTPDYRVGNFKLEIKSIKAYKN